MVNPLCRLAVAAALLLVVLGPASAQAPGSIRGTIYDLDFDVPVSGVVVVIAETSQKVESGDGGHFAFGQVRPGRYTVTFSKDGYIRQVKSDVLVQSGQLTDVDVLLAGEFTEMEEVVVEDIVEEPVKTETTSEKALLQLRLEAPSLLDSIGSELISRSGASDAAAAVRLVAGVSLADGKSAVVRGLPDRYVSSQLNGVRLPSSDEDKRAVELDQFPAAVIQNIQVSKTFTPDQQGDASGGAVDVRLKGIPDDPWFFRASSQLSFNSQVAGSDFLSYKGGGVNFLGIDDGGRDQQLDNLGMNWTGAAGVSRTDAPIDSKWSLSGGGRHEFDNGITIGGALSFFYERDSAFYDNGRRDSYWVTSPGAPMTPQYTQGTPQQGEFKTNLFDVTQATQSVQWGTLATFGVTTGYHSIDLIYFLSHTTEDTATLAEDTRGKQYFFPGYNPDDPSTPGHESPLAAPWVRFETLDYTERETESFQLRGNHKLFLPRVDIAGLIRTEVPELDWNAAFSDASSNQPDRRQFGSIWVPALDSGGTLLPPQHLGYGPVQNINLGNFQRIWETIDESSTQWGASLKLPFKQWNCEEGWFKLGLYRDSVDRQFDQDTFSNFGDLNGASPGEWQDFWSSHFPDQNHPIFAATTDVDYTGTQKISAAYSMLDIPITNALKAAAGLRFESTELGIINDPEADAFWLPPDTGSITQLLPGDADVAFKQDDFLPSLMLEYNPIDDLILRAAYNETVARQTFKELSPILQQDYLGGPIFIGNPGLGMSAVKNYDLRADYTPYEGALVSASWFKKDLKDPIEYVSKLASGFDYTTAVNYPKGTLEGWEFEVRQDLGRFWKPLAGLSAGANATFIDSEVSLPQDEIDQFNLPNILAPMSKRDMTNAPEHLYNLYCTYDVPCIGTQIGLFYTVQGDTLIAGAGQSNGNFIPSIYQKEYGTLNLSVAQPLGKHFKLTFQAKNLTNPEIKTVYRSEYIGDDVSRTSYTQGIEFSLTLSAEFRF
jgi:outer membrane receptor protein involved in Fe transport